MVDLAVRSDPHLAGTAAGEVAEQPAGQHLGVVDPHRPPVDDDPHRPGLGLLSRDQVDRGDGVGDLADPERVDAAEGDARYSPGIEVLVLIEVVLGHPVDVRGAPVGGPEFVETHRARVLLPGEVDRPGPVVPRSVGLLEGDVDRGVVARGIRGRRDQQARVGGKVPDLGEIVDRPGAAVPVGPLRAHVEGERGPVGTGLGPGEFRGGGVEEGFAGDEAGRGDEEGEEAQHGKPFVGVRPG